MNTLMQKNYGVWLKYEYRNGIINMFKEYRDISLTGAVEQMYLEMAGTYRTGWDRITILRAEEIAVSESTRAKIKQFHNTDTKYPILDNSRFANKLSKGLKITGKRPTSLYLN